jgi:membrane associated rhomboid family serine protease
MTDFKYTRPDNFPPIVKNLIIINVLVWVAQLVFDREGGTVTGRLSNILSLYPIQHPDFKPYQIATHMFAHAAYDRGGIVFYHILFNMFSLWMFGRILENVWGPKRFLLFYLICGVGAAALHLGIQYFRWEEAEKLLQAGREVEAIRMAQSIGPALGASGAIMGVFAAFGYLFPNTELYFMFIPIPLKAKWVVIGLAAIDLFGGVANFSGDNVAHFAHLGGALTGFILVLIWNRRNRKRFY